MTKGSTFLSIFIVAVLTLTKTALCIYLSLKRRNIFEISGCSLFILKIIINIKLMTLAGNVSFVLLEKF